MVIKNESFGETIRRYRTDKKLPLRKVAAHLDIDQAILSKIERGIRKATRNQVLDLAGFFNADKDNLLVAWLSDKIVQDLTEENSSLKVLQVAEEKIVYAAFRKTSRAAVIRKIKSVLKEFPAVEKAWLFGSFARKEDLPESDIDILIKVQNETEFTLFDISEIQEKLKLSINRRVDIVMLRAIRPQVNERIKQDLKLVYETGERSKQGTD